MRCRYVLNNYCVVLKCWNNPESMERIVRHLCLGVVQPKEMVGGSASIFTDRCGKIWALFGNFYIPPNIYRKPTAQARRHTFLSSTHNPRR